MKKKKKWAWLTKSAVVATIVGSLMSNGYQCYRNGQLDKQAALDRQRMEELKRKKQDLIDQLNQRISEINQRIDHLRTQMQINDLRRDAQGQGWPVPGHSNPAETAEIDRLENEKKFLQGEIDALYKEL